MSALDTVVVFSGGPRPPRPVVDSIPAGAPIIAADRGAEHATALGLSVALVVGDFDSIRPGSLDRLQRSGSRLQRHPPEKDATDLALALEAATALGPRRILVVGSAGGRLDHLMSSLLVLGAEAYANVEVDALLGRARVHVIRGERSLAGRPRELISLFALHGEARGVTSEGLVYPLRRQVLASGSTLGVSNLFAADTASIAVERGVVAAVCPGMRVSAAVFRRARDNVAAGTVSS